MNEGERVTSGCVALNGRFSGTKQPTGTQTVAYHLFDAIVRTPRNLSLTIFADSRFASISEWKQFPNVNWVEVPFQDWSRYQCQLWEQLVFPIQARNLGCKLAHHPINTSPMWSNGLKRIVTLHDLNFALHPEWYSWSFRNFLRYCAVPTLTYADRVVVVSEYVRKQVLNHLTIEPGRVEVVYNGVKPTEVQTDTLERLRAAGHPKYLLCVGSLQPHKNLSRLIQAFQMVREEGLVNELRVVGRSQGNFTLASETRQLLNSPGIVQTGYLNETDLSAAYAQAEVFCYPSLEEGFGLPVLEAMKAGTVVLTSNASCLPEIAGSAASLVDPLSVKDIAQGLRECLTLTPAQREERLRQGKEWASRFTWESSAKQYLKLYQEIFQSTLTDSRRKVAVF